MGPCLSARRRGQIQGKAGGGGGRNGGGLGMGGGVSIVMIHVVAVNKLW